MIVKKRTSLEDTTNLILYNPFTMIHDLFHWLTIGLIVEFPHISSIYFYRSSHCSVNSSCINVKYFMYSADSARPD